MIILPMWATSQRKQGWWSWFGNSRTVMSSWMWLFRKKKKWTNSTCCFILFRWIILISRATLFLHILMISSILICLSLILKTIERTNVSQLIQDFWVDQDYRIRSLDSSSLCRWLKIKSSLLRALKRTK